MTKEAFETLRNGVKSDEQDNALAQDSAAMALAMIDVFDELLSKLERIAVATETLAQSFAVDSYGQPSIRTSQL